MRPEHWLYTIPLQLRSLFRWAQADQDLDDELRDHLERKTEEYVAQGMTQEEAYRRARIDLGGIEQTKEQCRDARRVNWLQDFVQDLRYGLRMLLKNPGFSGVAVVVLGLGIAVNTTIFTALDATAFRPLPVRDPNHIVRVVRWIRQGYGGTLFSFREYVYYRDHNDVFSGLAADSCCYNVVYGGQPATSAATMPKSVLLSARIVSENYFEVLGINAVLGRTFLPDEGQSEKSNPVAVLGYQFWRQRLDSDPHILGKSLTLNAMPFTVVGIAPRDFIGTGDPPAAPDVWVLLAMQRYVVPGSNWMNANAYNVRIVGHLKPGVALTKTQVELTVLAQQLAHTSTAKDLTASTTHLTAKRASFLDFGGTGADFAVSVTLALAAAGMVLLIACANVANLLLARAIIRRKEVAARLVLGAGRSRIVRQLLTESAVIALLGGMAGLLLSAWACHVLWATVQQSLQKFYPPDLLLRVGPDVRILGYTLLLSLTTTFVFGLTPALQASKTDLMFALKQGVGISAPRSSRGLLKLNLRDALVLAQVSLSLVLLIAVGLLARSLQRSQTIDPGFETKNLLAVDMDFPALGYDSSMAFSLRRSIVERLDALPQVKSACFASEEWTAVSLESARNLPFVPYTVISPDYFRTLGIQIVRGRDFGETTQTGAPVVIVSEATARLLWPGEDPIGKRLMAKDRASSYAEVIGVVRDVRSVRPSQVDFAHLYFPIAPTDQYLGLWLRTRSNPENALDSIRETLGALDKGLLLATTHTISDLLWLQRLPALIGAAMAGILGVLALVLAAVGIYGVMAYVVSQRTHEIGVRMALGSDRADALALVLKQGMWPVLLGIILGLVGSVVLSHLLSFLLLGIGPLDPLAFSSASAFLIVVAALAAYLPSRRATKVDPMVALRYE